MFRDPADSSTGLTEIGIIVLTGLAAGTGKPSLRNCLIQRLSRLAFTPCASATPDVETPGWQSATTRALNSGVCLRRRLTGISISIDSVHQELSGRYTRLASPGLQGGTAGRLPSEFVKITEIINGGHNGLASREALYVAAKQAMEVAA